MLAAVAEGTGECLVLGFCFLQQLANFAMTWNTECPWCCLGWVDL
jgi:hypothetical protein